MDIKQAFAELGLNPQASQAEARAAYRTLAMRWHPDVNTGLDTETRMKAINVAYALVSQYLDRGFSEFDWKTGFKTGSSAQPRPREEWAERTIRVSLSEAAFGCVKRLNGMAVASCARCAGSGESSGTWTVGSPCVKCSGHGVVNVPGGAGTRATCAACQGSGVFKLAPPPCASCKGCGKTECQAWMVDVPIYAGTLDGTVVQTRDIRVRSGVHSLPRRFKLTVQIEKHPLFKLDHNRLSVAVPISVWRWALGGEITVPTLDGSTRVRLPSKPAALLVKNQGWPKYKALQQRSPLYVMPKIVFPEQLREEERRMLELLDVRSHLPEVQGWSRHVQAWTESSEQDLG